VVANKGKVAFAVGYLSINEADATAVEKALQKAKDAK